MSLRRAAESLKALKRKASEMDGEDADGPEAKKRREEEKAADKARRQAEAAARKEAKANRQKEAQARKQAKAEAAAKKKKEKADARKEKAAAKAKKRLNAQKKKAKAAVDENDTQVADFWKLYKKKVVEYEVEVSKPIKLQIDKILIDAEQDYITKYHSWEELGWPGIKAITEAMKQVG